MRRPLGLLIHAAASAFWLAASPNLPLARSDEMESALTLYVTISQDATAPSLYDYSFKLVLDDHTGTWAPGQGYGGLIFGDVRFADSPIADFAIDTSSFPVGPWTSLDQAGDDGAGNSYHNGPIFAPQFDQDFNIFYWYPSAIGDSLTWSGTSSQRLSPPDLRFSTLFTDGADPANFQRSVPEPAALAQILIGLSLAIGLLARRRALAARLGALGAAAAS